MKMLMKAGQNHWWNQLYILNNNMWGEWGRWSQQQCGWWCQCGFRSPVLFLCETNECSEDESDMSERDEPPSTRRDLCKARPGRSCQTHCCVFTLSFVIHHHKKGCASFPLTLSKPLTAIHLYNSSTRACITGVRFKENPSQVCVIFQNKPRTAVE